MFCGFAALREIISQSRKDADIYFGKKKRDATYLTPQNIYKTTE
jgi:hypothetical protein